VAFPVDDTMIPIVNRGTTALTIVPAGGVTLERAGTTDTGTRTLAAKGVAFLQKVETNIWMISGTLSHDGVLFAVFACSLSGQSFAAPSGMVSIVADSDATTPSFAVFAQQVGAGSTGTRSSAPSGGGRSTGILFALKGS
jgi:hypothetical protein